MLEAAQRGALLRDAAGVEGVNLDDPAKAVGFVGLLHIVKARLVLFPLEQAALGRQAVALLRGVAAVFTGAGAEVVVEVFLAGQVGAPGGETIAAVVEGALRARAAGIAAGLEQGIAGGRAAHLHGRMRRDAAVVDAARHDVPCALGVALEVDHRHAVRVHGLVHVVAAPLLGHVAALAAKQPDVGAGLFIDRAVLVVHDQQAFVVLAVQGEEVDAVVVVAHLLGLGGGVLAAIALELGGTVQQRRAPGGQHLGTVAGRNLDAVVGRDRNGLEADQRLAALAARCGATDQPPAQTQEHGRRQASAGAQKATARHGAGHHGLEFRVGAEVGGNIFAVEGGSLQIHGGRP